MHLRDRLVHFRLSDVYHPDPRDLAIDLHGGDLLQGKVLEVSHDGTPEGNYVVVKVEGVADALIVRSESILGVL